MVPLTCNNIEKYNKLSECDCDEVDFMSLCMHQSHLLGS